MTDESILAETFNDYFVNIESKLKEPITQPAFTKLREFVNSKIPENVKFELPDIDENFVFTNSENLLTQRSQKMSNLNYRILTRILSFFMSKLDISKSTELDGIGPRLLK